MLALAAGLVDADAAGLLEAMGLAEAPEVISIKGFFYDWVRLCAWNGIVHVPVHTTNQNMLFLTTNIVIDVSFTHFWYNDILFDAFF